MLLYCCYIILLFCCVVLFMYCHVDVLSRGRSRLGSDRLSPSGLGSGPGPRPKTLDPIPFWVRPTRHHCGLPPKKENNSVSWHNSIFFQRERVLIPMWRPGPNPDSKGLGPGPGTRGSNPYPKGLGPGRTQNPKMLRVRVGSNL
jgi:hypothetical protein